MKFQRDAFFDRLYEIAKKDRDVILVVADMSAPVLDKFRLDLPNQFVNVGIAEQNAIQIASGLALSGKKVFAYAISPFITLRALEQIRVSNCIMNIPITIVGMGTGLSYENDGPTHHLIEDIAIMRALPNMNIYNITDTIMAASIVNLVYNKGGVNYIRLDKDSYPEIYNSIYDFQDGIGECTSKDEAILISSGIMTHTAIEVANSLQEKGVSLGVCDIFRFPINTLLFLKIIACARRLITLEEHFLGGGLGSAICEVLNDAEVSIPVLRIGISMDTGYKFSYTYGGRELIRKRCEIDSVSVEKKIIKFLQKGV